MGSSELIWSVLSRTRLAHKFILEYSDVYVHVMG